MVSMARKGLPKKYAKMGFKRGWKAYKATLRRPRKRISTKTRRNKPMARRRYAKKVYRRARSSGGSFKPYIDGALGGIAAQLGTKYAGAWGTGLGYSAVGQFRNNPTLKVMGGIAIGRQIAGMIPMIGGNGGGTSQGVFE